MSSRAVFAELAMKRTPRSGRGVAEAIRLARAREPHAEISGSRWQASTAEVRNSALNTPGFEIGADGSIPEQAITAYNQTCRPPVLNHTRTRVLNAATR